MWRRPRQVVAHLLQGPEREDRALIILMSACILCFVAQWPPTARTAHVEGLELNPLLGGALLMWLFVVPLALYVIAFVSRLILRAFLPELSGYRARFVLFWALLASAPVMLLSGLAVGFLGDVPGVQGIGILWILSFIGFWFAGLMQAGRG